MILLIVFGAIETCSIVFLQQNLQLIAYEAARVAASPYHDAQDGRTAGRQIMDQLELRGGTVTIETDQIFTVLMGDAVACVLSENLPTPLVKVGVEDEFGQSGLITAERDELMEHFAFGAADLAVSVKECLKKKERVR